jgi:nitric oxide dioxygenase
MTPDEIASVRNSFAMVAPIAGPAGVLFYDKLFALDPSLRRLFTATSPSRSPSSCRYWHSRWRI